MTEEEALQALKFHFEYVDEININNSDALVYIVKKDLDGLKDCLDYLIKWRKEWDDLKFPKADYQKAIELFIQKFKTNRERNENGTNRKHFKKNSW